MIHSWGLRLPTVLAILIASVPRLLCDPAPAVPLPQGVVAVWDLGKAYQESTPAQERICLNGLWRWQPAAGPGNAPVPTANWGFFKVPGCWPGITDYMQKDCQTLFAHPNWRVENSGNLTSAWYEREIIIPENWSGRRITVSAEYLNSFAVVYLDGHEAGEIRFPAGEVDLSSWCVPGKKQWLTVRVTAMPLKGVLLSYTDSASAREVKGSVARRGFCGDVFLIGTRPGPRVGDVKITTSVRNRTIAFQAALPGLELGASYRLRARVIENDGHSLDWTSAEFTAAALVEGRYEWAEKWIPERLWDVHTPHYQCQAVLTLIDAGGAMRDRSLPARFAFREFWIDGRDFYLNGSRIFLSAVPVDNAEVGAAWAGYDAARETFERLKTFGINFVYTHNYGCQPGSHLSFEEILRAADDVGMLVSLSQPHFSHYEWKSARADETNGYAQHARFYTGAAQNHPSVVFYSMSHNATGYSEDMNPDLIDGIHDPRDQWSSNNAKLALRAESIVRHLDPSRIVYHHASGNLGSMHAINFYPNFVPIQELSDWFGHWSTRGVKPVFLCEYGAPFTWDWTMYRGWYRGQREFGSARVPWEFCVAEWNAQFFGDRAFGISPAEKTNLRWEAKQFRAGNVWHRWDYPNQVGSSVFDENYPVFAMYITDNWRAFRTWGVSANSPWEYGHFWKVRNGVNRARQELKVDWEKLQRPGFSADYIQQPFERMDLAFARSDWIATTAAEALVRNNGPVLAYIAGGDSGFTSKDHDFFPGREVSKQVIIINNSRETLSGKGEWSCDLPVPVRGAFELRLPTGEQKRFPIRIQLPRSVPAGKYQLIATVRFSNGSIERDAFAIEVLPPSGLPDPPAKIALFDPHGETEKWLREKGIASERVDARASLANYELLIIGKGSLTASGPAPDISGVRRGLKVVVFEQTSEALEKRLGFRAEEYGLRRVFQRQLNHPILAGLEAEPLADWAGEATLVPSQLKYEMRQRYGPTVSWCGIPVTRVWRCGNRGNVASVLIEKPARGDFLPIIDGGYRLQYSPLLEYREGKGLVLFCQMDVTARTREEPAAEILLCNLLQYLKTWKPAPERKIFYAGESDGLSFFQSAGIEAAPFESGKLAPDSVLIAGPGSGNALAYAKSEIAKWLDAGGRLLAIGLAEAEANSFLPSPVKTKTAEHISSFFSAQDWKSPLRGIGPADVHNRDPREFPLMASGADALGDGVIAWRDNPRVIFCQMAPWHFSETHLMNVKRTFRRLSFLVARLAANLGASSSTPLLERFSTPVKAGEHEERWSQGLYLDQPVEWDDPYRFFRW